MADTDLALLERFRSARNADAFAEIVDCSGRRSRPATTP